MGRVEIPLVVIDPNNSNPVEGAEVEVKDRGTLDPSTVYSAESGGGTETQPLETDENGRITGWLGYGKYLFEVTPPGEITPTISESFDANPSDTPSDVRATLGFNNTATDVFGFTDAGLSSSIETALMAILGQERTVARASGVLVADAASQTFLPTNDHLWASGNIVLNLAARRLQPDALWRPTSGFLLPVAGLKSILTLKCWAVSGETDPTLASGEVQGYLGWVTGEASGSAGELRYTVDVALPGTLGMNAPVVTGNGDVGEASGTLDIDAAGDLTYLGNADYALCPVLRTSGTYAQASSAPVHYFLELTHKYADID